MKKRYACAIIFLSSFLTTFSQTKEIKGDTASSYKSNIGLQKTLDLKDFEKSPDEFNFRFRNLGQIIEISKDGSLINGSITNYIYHTIKANANKTEILSQKIDLTSKQAETIYEIVQQSGILNLPSDKNIEQWTQGFDGITYIIEHADKNNYWFKRYWTPSSQDSIPEAIVVLGFVKDLADTLNLQEVYSSFKNTLPKKGCYNSGGITNVCYISNSLELGYSGAIKLPLGFYSSYSATYIGKAKINGSASLQYNFSHAGYHHLNLQLAKWNIFYKNSNLSDFIVYNYQNRNLKIDQSKNKFENHQIKYGLNLKKNFGVGIGLDYVSGKHDKAGGHLYGYKWLSKLNLSTLLTASIFDNQVNYKAEVFKSFNFNRRFLINRFSLGVAYENFMGYKDTYFCIRVLL